MLLVTAFFITMNVLLWQSEFRGQPFGARVSAESVWEKVLTAPDNSFLTIRHHGKKVGTCHWAPSIAQERPGVASEDSPEGMIEAPTSYSIEVNGNIIVEETSRVRFSIDLRLSTNQAWQELDIRVGLRPSVWELHSVAAEQSLRLHIEDGQERTDKVFSFADLRNPDRILKEIGGPLLPAALAPLGLFPSTSGGAQPKLSLGLQWQGRFDRLRVGGELMRVYRIQARLLDRFQAIFYVSPVGEILKIELPDQLVLMNDALANLSALEDDRTDPRR